MRARFLPPSISLRALTLHLLMMMSGRGADVVEEGGGQCRPWDSAQDGRQMTSARTELPHSSI